MKITVKFDIDMDTGNYDVDFKSENGKPIDYYCAKLVLERALQDISIQIGTPKELEIQSTKIDKDLLH